MKKIALFSLIIMGLATILSSTCKKDPYNIGSNNGNNNNNNNYDTTASFNVYVQDSSQPNQNIAGATIFLYNSKPVMLEAIQAGSLALQAQYVANTIAVNGDSTNNYANFTVPAPNAPTTKLYYIYALANNPNNSNDFRYAIDSISVSRCAICRQPNITIILPKW